MSLPAWMSSSSRALVIGSFLFGFGASSVVADPVDRMSDKEKSQLVDRILAHWRARQERFKAFHVEWEHALRYGMRTSVLKDATIKLWSDGFRYRLERDDGNRDQARCTFDGMTTRLWRSPRHGDVWFGEHKDEQLSRVWTVPWTVGLNPLSCPVIDPKSPQLRVVSVTSHIETARCVKLAHERGDSTVARTDVFWVDSDREDVLLLWEVRSETEEIASLSIDYTQHPSQGWIPNRWTRKENGHHEIGFGVASCFEFAQRYPDSTFRLAFPPDTAVEDRQLSQNYEIAADGSKVKASTQGLPVPAEVDHALDQLTDFVVEPEPLEEALQFVAKRYSIRVAIDQASVCRGLIDPHVEVKTKKRQIKLKELIDLLLQQSPRPLRYEIRDGVLTVTSAHK